MKKLITLALVLLMAFTLLVLPISANQPVDQLTQMAELAPADAPLFIVIRSDDGIIDTLNTILVDKVNDIAAQIGEPAPDINLRDALGNALGLYDEGQSFDTNVRPWLGDHVALFLPSADTLTQGSSSNPLTIVAQNKDLSAAVDYLDLIYQFDIEFGDLEKVEQEDGSVLYNPTVSFLPATLVTKDLVIVGDTESVVMPGEDARKLSSTDAFQAAVSALPETEYNALVYLDPKPVLDLVASFGPMMLGDAWPDLDMNAIADSLGQMALGFTILQDRSLVLDFAATGSMMVAGDPLDLSLLDRVPADAALVMENQGMGAHVQRLLDSLHQADTMWNQMGLAEQMDLGALSFLSPGDIATFSTLLVEGTFNLDLEETLAWMNGDHVAFIRPNITDNLLTSGLQSGSLLVIDQPEAAAQLVEKVAEYVTRMYSGATYADGTLSVSLDALLGQTGLAGFTLTATDDFLAAGSTPAVDALLNPGDSITGTDAYAFESNLFLNEPSALYYINGAAIREAASQAIKLFGTQVTVSDAQAIDALFSVFESAAITVNSDENRTRTRFTITLSE